MKHGRNIFKDNGYCIDERSKCHEFIVGPWSFGGNDPNWDARIRSAYCSLFGRYLTFDDDNEAPVCCDECENKYPSYK